MRPSSDMNRYVPFAPQDQPLAPKVLYVEQGGGTYVYLVDDIKNSSNTVSGYRTSQDGQQVEVICFPNHLKWHLVDASYVEVITPEEYEKAHIVDTASANAMQVRAIIAGKRAQQQALDEAQRSPLPTDWLERLERDLLNGEEG